MKQQGKLVSRCFQKCSLSHKSLRILVTGANGFLGSHLVEFASSDDGNTVYSGVRANANLKYLNGLRTEITILNYRDLESLVACLNSFKKDGKLDLIIHNAGLTKSNSISDNLDVNKGITANVIEAIRQSGCLSDNGKFTYISSMAALGPVGAGGPVSAYGHSKLKAEEIVKNSGLPYLIFRPTAIYGPRDSSFLAMFKSGKLGLYPNIASTHQKITMIYGADVAKLVFHYAGTWKNKIVHLDDGQVYSHQDFRNALEASFQRSVKYFKVPGPIILGALFFLEMLTSIMKKKPVLTREKYREIRQDWNHDLKEEHNMLKDLNLISLKDGFANTLQYYREQNLL